MWSQVNVRGRWSNKDANAASITATVGRTEADLGSACVLQGGVAVLKSLVSPHTQTGHPDTGQVSPGVPAKEQLELNRC